MRSCPSRAADGGDYLVLRTPDNPAFHWGNYVLAGQPWLERPLADLVKVFHTEHPGAQHLAIGVDGVDGRVWGGAASPPRRRMPDARLRCRLGGWFGVFVDGEMVSGLGLFTDGSTDHLVSWTPRSRLGWPDRRTVPRFDS